MEMARPERISVLVIVMAAEAAPVNKLSATDARIGVVFMADTLPHNWRAGNAPRVRRNGQIFRVLDRPGGPI